MSCTACQEAAPGWCSSPDGVVAGTTGDGNTQLRYFGGGVGADAMPGFAAWRASFGRHWTHDYAERIVLDPDFSHVWLLTRYGGFHEFYDLAGGSGLRLYQSRAPADEFRQLYYDTSTLTWQLKGLDGSTVLFRTDGQWDRTTTTQDPTHPTLGVYNGSNQLTSIEYPDGHSDTLTYQLGGKLASISQVAVAGTGTPARTWTLTWSGDELTVITRPDGTSHELFYDPTRPGYLSRVDLVAGGEHRVEVAFSYLAGTNRVEKTWRGDPSFTDTNAVDKVTFSYTNPSLPTQAVVTRSVSPTFDRVTTINLEHVAASNSKLRVISFTDSCPSCGLSPTTTFTYAGSNPLLPSATTDAKGTRTDYTYDVNGRLLSKVEAANVSGLARTTSYTYDATFPGLITRVEVPSTSGGSNKRRTDQGYSATGVLVSRTIDGFEAGMALPAGFKPTVYTPNASGEVLTVDPPGFGTTDVTSFTYNLAGRNGHVADSRTDPLVGTTTFGYDGLNRRKVVTDVNGVLTTTSYDAMNRVVELRRLGATPPTDDLVTSSTYNSFGDLFCTKLPEGNGVQYDYDGVGRLIAVQRGKAVEIPNASQCLDPAQPRERTAYQLDATGNRSEESLERWNGSAWASESKTTYVYTCHLDKVTQGAISPTTVTEYCYDPNDNLEKVWDGNHPKSSNPGTPTQLHEYDDLNRLKKLTVGIGTSNAAATSYAYDVQDHLASVTDAEGNQTTYTTSDRDLLTKEISPVFSGATNYTTHEYNEHGQLQKTTDPRSVETNRTVDAADRVTQETFGLAGTPDPALTNTYSFGATTSQFNVGRLIGITRNGQTIAYTYDRFGRTLQDGALVYEYDKNGNRTRINYPGSVAAIYTFDFENRATSLSYDSGGGPQPLVSAVAYRALGPLSSLTLGNGLVETRTFDGRNFIGRIQAGSLMDWVYTLDAIGNPTGITGSINGVSFAPSFAYQDSLYFLTQGNGPWGNRSWTYDKIGNRLTFARTSEPTQTYAYTSHNPKLQTVTPVPGLGTGSWTYQHDAAGNQTQLLEADAEGPTQTSFFDAAADGRMSALRTSNGPSRTDMTYDGRGFLRRALLTVTPPGDYIDVAPVYSSDGLLYARTEQRQSSGGLAGNGEDDPSFSQLSSDTTQLFYFAGRPVAQLTNEVELLYLTTDHLATPVLATDTSGSVVWAGALEPFGAMWTATADNPDTGGFSVSTQRRAGAAAGKRAQPPGVLGAPGPPPTSRLSAEKVFLRYPGQWVSDAFRVTGTQQDVRYNVHRWYEPATGRYTGDDPLGDQLTSGYAYALDNPTSYIDPLGLVTVTQGSRFVWVIDGGKYSLGFGKITTSGSCVCGAGGFYARLNLNFEHGYQCSGSRTCRRERLHMNIASSYVVRAAQFWRPYERVPFQDKDECELYAAMYAIDMQNNLFRRDPALRRYHNETQELYEDTHREWSICAVFTGLCAAQ